MENQNSHQQHKENEYRSVSMPVLNLVKGKEQEDGDMYHPHAPVNFGKVAKGVYRSSKPSLHNEKFFHDLGIKSVICMFPDDYPDSVKQFFEQHNIKLFHFPTRGNSDKREQFMNDVMVKNALDVISDPKNHPVLIHCRKGMHRTGTVIGCYRKLQNWEIKDILEEYLLYAGEKARVCDQNYIKDFDHQTYSNPNLNINDAKLNNSEQNNEEKSAVDVCE